MRQFNKAWGFEDGECNVEVDGKYQDKPGVTEEFREAHYRIAAGDRLAILVSIHKSGRKSFSIMR